MGGWVLNLGNGTVALTSPGPWGQTCACSLASSCDSSVSLELLLATRLQSWRAKICRVISACFFLSSVQDLNGLPTRPVSCSRGSLVSPSGPTRTNSWPWSGARAPCSTRGWAQRFLSGTWPGESSSWSGRSTSAATRESRKRVSW